MIAFIFPVALVAGLCRTLVFNLIPQIPCFSTLFWHLIPSIFCHDLQFSYSIQLQAKYGSVANQPCILVVDLIHRICLCPGTGTFEILFANHSQIRCFICVVLFYLAPFCIFVAITHRFHTTLFYFARLCINRYRSVWTLGAVTPHALRARVVINHILHMYVHRWARSAM